jgi:hypothetical protein
MEDFKIGDRVKRIGGAFCEVVTDGEYIVREVGGVFSLSSLDGRELRGNYDEESFTLVSRAPSRFITVVPNVVYVGNKDVTFEVGDEVTFIDEDGKGDSKARQGDTGTILQIDREGLVTFKNGRGQMITVRQSRLRKNEQVVIPNVSVDEAVEKCQTLRKQIEELQAEVKGFEAVMKKAGIKFI